MLTNIHACLALELQLGNMAKFQIKGNIIHRLVLVERNKLSVPALFAPLALAGTNRAEFAYQLQNAGHYKQLVASQATSAIL